MKTRTTANSNLLPPLTLSRKAVPDISRSLHNLPDAVFQTDLNLNITGWNYTAGQLHGVPGAMGKNLFSLIKIDFIHSTFESVKQDLMQKGCWEDEVIFHRHDGKKYFFRTSANFLFNGQGEKTGIIFISHNITQEKNTELKLAEAEFTYKKLVNTLIDGVLMVDADGRINACNKSACRILGLNEEELLEKNINSLQWKVIKPDGTIFPAFEFPATVSLQTGFPQRNVKMGICQANDVLIWLSVNSEALIRHNEFEPYAAVVSFSDITESVKRKEELRKSNERFFYVSKLTTDAIWDLDLTTNEIYRSEAFFELSGYTNNDIKPDLNWWFDKVHPEDRDRVKNKVSEYIEKKFETWEDEYRFLCADGQYKILLDSGTILYRNMQPVRILGAIRDLTEKKKLEQQLLQEQEQKHKAIEKATIKAQEAERNEISSELHDNVNQVLMSSKLYLDSAKKNPENYMEMLDKAMECQMMAVTEIRKLSHKLNSSLVKATGLEKSITEIVKNMILFSDISGNFSFDKTLEKKLPEEQKLMVYRIVQEQTNNIVKYSGAEKFSISLKEAGKQVTLEISDNGIGFDTAIQSNGIGFINIFNRVAAFNGSVKLISSPGNGCRVEIIFPAH